MDGGKAAASLLVTDSAPLRENVKHLSIPATPGWWWVFVFAFPPFFLLQFIDNSAHALK